MSGRQDGMPPRRRRGIPLLQRGRGQRQAAGVLPTTHARAKHAGTTTSTTGTTTSSTGTPTSSTGTTIIPTGTTGTTRPCRAPPLARASHENGTSTSSSTRTSTTTGTPHRRHLPAARARPCSPPRAARRQGGSTDCVLTGLGGGRAWRQGAMHAGTSAAGGPSARGSSDRTSPTPSCAHPQRPRVQAFVDYLDTTQSSLCALLCEVGARDRRREALKVCHSPSRACVYDDRGLAARYGYGSDSGTGCAKRLEARGKCPPKTKP